MYKCDQCACFTKEKCDNAIRESESSGYQPPKENYLNVIEHKDDNIFKSLKNEGKIRIYFYGENLLRLLIEQTTYRDFTSLLHISFINQFTLSKITFINCSCQFSPSCR